MKESRFSNVEATQPLAPWIGGKRNLAKRIIARLESIEHQTYAEPFVGMGGVFLRRTMIPRGEVINDYSGEITNFFRILQRHYPQFMDTIRFQVTTRRGFERLLKTDPSTLTDLERAARFIYLQRTAFGGKVTQQTFGVSTDRPARFDLIKLADHFEALHERLSAVVIENLDWSVFLEKYDRDNTLFYLDPPYWGCEGDYGKDLFGREQFAKMAEQLETLKGRFLMSINDVPEVRELFASFEIEPVTTTYTLSDKKAKKVGELLISNC